MMPPLGDVEQTLLDAWNNHRTSHSEKAKDADNDASNVNCGGEASEGLKGINLATGVDGSSGLASPEAWMAAWRAKHSTKAGKVSPGTVSAAPSLRRLDLNGMPKWAKISDVLSLVHGGAVERVTVDTPGHAIVLFCNENDSKTYFSRYEQGIRIAEDELIITLELGPEQHPVDKNLLAEIVAGATRVVSITAASHEISHYIDKALQGDYQIDQIIYRADTDKVHILHFLFASIADAVKFTSTAKKECNVEESAVAYEDDPCKIASGFHSDSPAVRMLSAGATEL